MRSQVWWDAARAGGIVAWALASLAVIGGLQLSTRLVRRPAPAWVLDVHRFVAGLAVVFTGVHLLGLFLDTFTTFGAAELFVPFVSSYRPTAVAVGIVAFYLLLAVEITSLAMRRMPRKTWHAVHLSSYALFVFATLHGLTAGTDRHNAAFQWACILVSAVVLFMTLVRVLAPGKGARAPATRGDTSRRTP
jgi:DMSO/TMAO reductase YedYZ heme-binding membrane subunit